MIGSFSSEGRPPASPRGGALGSRSGGCGSGCARIEIEHIKPHPDCGTATLDFTIETPWWLPDIHISHTGSSAASRTSRRRRVDMPVNGAQALLPGWERLSIWPCRCRRARTIRAAVLTGAARFWGRRRRSRGLRGAHAGARRQRHRARLRGDRDGWARDGRDDAARGEPAGERRAVRGLRGGRGGRAAAAAVRCGAGVWTTLVAPEDSSTADVDPVNDTVAELVAKFTSS